MTQPKQDAAKQPEHVGFQQVAKKINASTLDRAAQAPQPGAQLPGLPEHGKAASPTPDGCTPRSQAVASPEARSQESGGPTRAFSRLVAGPHQNSALLFNTRARSRSGSASASMSRHVLLQVSVRPGNATSCQQAAHTPIEQSAAPLSLVGKEQDAPPGHLAGKGDAQPDSCKPRHCRMLQVWHLTSYASTPFASLCRGWLGLAQASHLRGSDVAVPPVKPLNKSG